MYDQFEFMKMAAVRKGRKRALTSVILGIVCFMLVYLFRLNGTVAEWAFVLPGTFMVIRGIWIAANQNARKYEEALLRDVKAAGYDVEKVKQELSRANIYVNGRIVISEHFTFLNAYGTRPKAIENSRICWVYSKDGFVNDTSLHLILGFLLSMAGFILLRFSLFGGNANPPVLLYIYTEGKKKPYVTRAGLSRSYLDSIFTDLQKYGPEDMLVGYSKYRMQEYKASWTRDKHTQEYSQNARDIIEVLGYPHKVFARKSNYYDVMEAYKNSLRRGEKEGFTPVLVVVKPDSDSLVELLQECFLKEHHTVEEFLDIDYDRQKIREMIWDGIRESIEQDEETEQLLQETYEREPDPYEKFESMIADQENRTHEVILFEVPTRNPWEVVACIPFEYGGWNGIPDQIEMQQICRYFYEEYEAVPVVISADELEMAVPKLIPQERVHEVTMEHWAFAPETSNMEILQMREKINRSSKKWYFWWD